MHIEPLIYVLLIAAAIVMFVAGIVKDFPLKVIRAYGVCILLVFVRLLLVLIE